MRYANHMQFMEKLRLKLLAAGLTGISQHDINQTTRTKIFNRDDILEVLEEWEHRGWTQRFKVTGFSKHPKIMWRATTLLRDNWSAFRLEQESDEELAEPGQH